MHREVREAQNTRRGQQWASSTYVVERPQKIVRQDNLSVGGAFYGQSEARSYGNFARHDNTQRVERVTKKVNTSNISLGDSNVSIATAYKRDYVPRHTGPCPATLIDKPTGPFKHTRDTKTHKFYAPMTPIN